MLWTIPVEKRTEESVKLKEQISQAKIKLKEAQQNSILKKQYVLHDQHQGSQNVFSVRFRITLWTPKVSFLISYG